jgi:hypothetical protein
MTLPEGFSEWEHLQSTMFSAYNRFVREEFSDIEDDDNISTPRSSLKVACLMQDSDTAAIAAVRMMFFYMTIRKAQDLQRPVYGIPYTAIQETRKYKPQITLHFMEDLEDVDSEAGYQPVYGEIAFRLMNESSTTITESELYNYANRIQSTFGSGNGFVWQKGKAMITYTQPDRGYKLQVNCRSEGAGRNVVERVLSVQSHSVDLEYMNFKENKAPADAYPNNPGSTVILGKSRANPRRRPVANVRFRYAVAHIHGLAVPITLYDRTGYHRNALVTEYSV